VIFALALIGFGALFSWGAVRGWRYRNEASITLLEVSILKITGDEPLPVTWLDRWLQRFHLIMMTIFGPLMVILGSYGLFLEMDML
jgi:hypothetical protein